MRLVRTIVKRHTTNGASELHINVELTPLGGLVAGAAIAWAGWQALKALRKQWWLPIGAGLTMLVLRQISHQSQERVVSNQEE